MVVNGFLLNEVKLMFISNLSWDLWEGNHDRGETIAVTNWNQIDEAIAALDGRSRTLVTLEGEGEVHMAIGGGDGRYVVYVTFDNEEFEYLVDRSQVGHGRFNLMVGGQMGDYLERWCVELPIVLQAARLFAETGQVERSVWERDLVAV